MFGARTAACRACWCLVLLLLLSNTGGSRGRSLFSRQQQQQQQQEQPAASGSSGTDGGDSSSSSSSSGSSGVDAGGSSNSTTAVSDEDLSVGSAVAKMLKHTFKNQSLPQIRDMLFPLLSANHSKNGTHAKKNFTAPKWEDLVPKNFSMKAAIQDALKNITAGMTAMEFAKALMTGTISANTADTNTPDKGLADVQSGAININPFMDGAALSNALTLAGRDATANSRGMVLGMIGTGRSSSQATALGVSGAKASTDTFSLNGGGVSQNAMSSNLAATPQGRADTSVRSAAFNILGHTATGGLTFALGKKGAASAGLGAGMTGLGESYGTQFANSLSLGDTSSNTGVLAGTLTGAAKATVGSVSTSAKKSAQSQSLSTSKSAIGSATSKSASLSTAAQNASGKSGSVASTGVGNVASISSTTSTGMNADSRASSNATSQAGAANARATSRAFGVTSAKSASTASSTPHLSGTRDTPVLWTQRRRASTTWSRSKAASSTLQGGTPAWSALNPLSRFVPAFLQHGAPAHAGADTTLPLVGEAFISAVGLKALLPGVPKITPQLPTLNQTIHINGTAEACNETEINLNRTAEQSWLRCNETSKNASITPIAVPNNPDPMGGLPGLGFFKNLRDMNNQFIKDSKDKDASKPPPPGGHKAPPAGAAAAPGGQPAAPPPPKPPQARLKTGLRGNPFAGGGGGGSGGAAAGKGSGGGGGTASKGGGKQGGAGPQGGAGAKSPGQQPGGPRWQA